MENWKIKLSIFINYFLFAILLNSVGSVILQAQRFYHVTEGQASVLEGFKDLSIAITSFVVGNFITRIGYKHSMLFALAVVSAACFIVPSIHSFFIIKLLFAVVGFGFGVVKVAVFGTIGLVTGSAKEHVSIMSFIESFFMVGIISGSFLFGLMVDDKNPASASWLTSYYVMGGLGVVAILLLLMAPLDETDARQTEEDQSGKDYGLMLRLLVLPLVISFIVCAFLYVLIEQSIMSWLPTFNNKVLHIPSSYSILLSAILSGSIALGRFAAGILLKKVHWLPVLIACLIGAAILVLMALPIAKSVNPVPINRINDIPIEAYIFPLIGFFLAPIYPAINSAILASLPKAQHGAMSGLIVVFSALGGTLGSIITGNIFQHYGGQFAFYFSLLPLAVLMIALIFFSRKISSIRRTK